MALDLQQTDTSPTCSSGGNYCTGLTTHNSVQGGSHATQGGTAGSTEQVTSMDRPTTNVIWWFFECVIPTGASWDAGTWTVRLNCTTAASGLSISSIYICRINSSCTSQATIGSATGLSISLATTGVKSQTITGIAQTPSAGDLVMIVVCVTNTNSHGSQSLGVTPNQLISTPFLVSSTYNESLTIAGTAAETIAVANMMNVSELLTGAVDVATQGGLDFNAAFSIDGAANQSIDVANLLNVAFINVGIADETIDSLMIMNAVADLVGAVAETIDASNNLNAAESLGAVAALIAQGGLNLVASFLLDGAVGEIFNVQRELNELITLSGTIDSTVDAKNVLGVAIVLVGTADVAIGVLLNALANLTIAGSASVVIDGTIQGGGTVYNVNVGIITSAGISMGTFMIVTGDVVLNANGAINIAETLNIAVRLTLAGLAQISENTQLDAMAQASIDAAVGTILNSKLEIHESLVMDAIADVATRGGFTYNEVIDLIGSGDVATSSNVVSAIVSRIFASGSSSPMEKVSGANVPKHIGTGGDTTI